MSSKIIEVVIGLSFTYLLLSLICSALNEMIAGLCALRGHTLAKGIRTLLGSETLQKMLYEQPLIKSLSHGTWWWKMPSYLPSELFAAALTELAPFGSDDEVNPAGVTVDDWRNVQSAVGALVAGTPVERAVEAQRLAIAKWFDAGMERVSGAYKRRAQLILALLAVLVCLTINADSVVIARSLWTDDRLRGAIAEEAATLVASQPKPQGPSTEGSQPTPSAEDRIKKANEGYAEAMTKLSGLGLPLGWSDREGPAEVLHDGKKLPEKILGLVLTAIAISLGAPFWFDTVNKLVNVRAAGKKPERADARPG